MSLRAEELKLTVIQPTLDYLGIRAPNADLLLLATAQLSSKMNPCKVSSTGLGIYQITAEQHQNLWDKTLAFQPDLASKVRGLASQHRFLQEPHQELASNLAYSTAIAWLIYHYAGMGALTDTSADALRRCWQQFFCNSANELAA